MHLLFNYNYLIKIKNTKNSKNNYTFYLCFCATRILKLNFHFTTKKEILERKIKYKIRKKKKLKYGIFKRRLWLATFSANCN